MVISNNYPRSQGVAAYHAVKLNATKKQSTINCLCLKSERSNNSAASVSFYVDSSSWHWGRHILIDLIRLRQWLTPGAERSRLYIHPRVHDSSSNGFSMSFTQLRLTLFCSHQHLSCEEWEHAMTNILNCNIFPLLRSSDWVPDVVTWLAPTCHHVTSLPRPGVR